MPRGREAELTIVSVIGSGARFIPQSPATAAMSVSPAEITVTTRSRATNAFRLHEFCVFQHANRAAGRSIVFYFEPDFSLWPNRTRIYCTSNIPAMPSELSYQSQGRVHATRGCNRERGLASDPIQWRPAPLCHRWTTSGDSAGTRNDPPVSSMRMAQRNTHCR